MTAKATSSPFTFTKRGIFYFRRRVPKQLRRLYATDFITTSLKTRDVRDAGRKASQLASQLDAYWFQLSFQDRFTKVIGTPTQTYAIANAPEKPSPKISEVKATYLKLSGTGRAKTFQQAVDRSFDLLLGLKGDKPVAMYTRADVNALRDKLLKSGLAPQSVQRTFSTLRAAFNVAINELDLGCPNVFLNVRINTSSSIQKRNAFGAETLRLIQTECIKTNSETTRLVALISDTGMRLAEAVGLLIDDIVLDADIPHINLIEHDWRPLKTATSTRKIPLVGCSLWAAKEVIAHRQNGELFAFPSSCNINVCKSNSASARLNKWLNKYVDDRSVVIHSFRHSLRDRLRAIECPADMTDQIGGWRSMGVGVRYGNGYPLANTHDWMQRIVIT